MDEFSMSSHFNEDGSINAEGPGLATLAGEEHVETKCFDDIKDFTSLCKITADHKSMIGKQAKQIENSIIKPGENATDEDHANYRTTLNTERGAPKSGAEYELTRPEGIPYDEAREAAYREFCCTKGVPKDTAKMIWDWYHEDLVAKHNTAKTTESDKATVDQEKLRTDWPGDAMIEKPRLAYAALQALGPELYPDFWKDFKGPSGEMISGLKTKLAESNIYDSPGDLAKWLECGIDVGQLKFFEVLGRRMKAGTLAASEGGGGGEDKKEAFSDACSSKSTMAKKEQ